jgi:CheY-like chemotaxis protein
MLKPDALIMIVDDSNLVRMSLTRMFQSLGFTNIVTAGNGVEAVDLHVQLRPDLIMLDIVMPEMRGDEALVKIRSTDAVTPIIMLSSVSKESEIASCRRDGATEFLIKPLVAHQGRATLRAAISAM